MLINLVINNNHNFKIHFNNKAKITAKYLIKINLLKSNNN
jgi:hypothetical protein